MVTAQSDQTMPVVPNRRDAGAQCTATTCNASVPTSDIHNIRLSKKWALNAEPFSLRALNTLKNWNSTNVVNASVKARVFAAGVQAVVQHRQRAHHHRDAVGKNSHHARQRQNRLDRVGAAARS